jgi:hypothetical protein
VARRAKPKYNSDRGPTQAFWEQLSEEEQIRAIATHHRLRSISLPDPRLHALSHLMAEQQLASGEVPAAQATLDRLIEEGLDRHEALHAVAWVLTSLMNEIAAGRFEGEFLPTYEEQLRTLPESWYDTFDEDQEHELR